MFKVSVSGTFSSAHFLRNYKGKCENIHGHNYKVEVIIKSNNLQDNQILIDFSELKTYLKNILNELDHKLLNNLDFFQKNNPTSEMIAFYIFEKIKKKYKSLYSVKVWETEQQYAEYYEE
ncbi:MAG: 6-carboxytetrahydropterin synthase QueD [Spirochaetes bacterium]|nr:6-carboxytetrahydropterin synthase QueD [Spirochaetota bacterium]